MEDAKSLSGLRLAKWNRVCDLGKSVVDRLNDIHQNKGSKRLSARSRLTLSASNS